MNKQFNEYTSICNTCYCKGWHEKPEKCKRTHFIGCDSCRSNENISDETKCKGMNIMIDYSAISKQFIPYYESQERIKVKISDSDEIKSGTIGITTGWKPIFILMLTKRSTGSSYILSDNDKIL